MDILLDNTGFQNFSSCFERKCTPEKVHDAVKDFLQICLQIIFYDTFSPSILVPKQLKESYSQVFEKIKGKDPSILSLYEQYTDDKETDDTLNLIAYRYYDRINDVLSICKDLAKNNADNVIGIPLLDKEYLRITENWYRSD